MTAIFFPVRTLGGSGLIQPSRNAWLMTLSSICLIVTGLSLIPNTQAASQGAGQTQPVNSGKLLVLCRTAMASCQRSR